jgi:hypothetical protein
MISICQDTGIGELFDANGDNRYGSVRWRLPAIEGEAVLIESNFPDEIVLVYNDAGNTHTNTNGKPIRMEVQVQAFAYATMTDNNMTFTGISHQQSCVCN